MWSFIVNFLDDLSKNPILSFVNIIIGISGFTIIKLWSKLASLRRSNDAILVSNSSLIDDIRKKNHQIGELTRLVSKQNNDLEILNTVLPTGDKELHQLYHGIGNVLVHADELKKISGDRHFDENSTRELKEFSRKYCEIIARTRLIYLENMYCARMNNSVLIFENCFKIFKKFFALKYDNDQNEFGILSCDMLALNERELDFFYENSKKFKDIVSCDFMLSTFLFKDAILAGCGNLPDGYVSIDFEEELAQILDFGSKDIIDRSKLIPNILLSIFTINQFNGFYKGKYDVDLDTIDDIIIESESSCNMQPTAICLLDFAKYFRNSVRFIDGQQLMHAYEIYSVKYPSVTYQLQQSQFYRKSYLV